MAKKDLYHNIAFHLWIAQHTTASQIGYLDLAGFEGAVIC